MVEKLKVGDVIYLLADEHKDSRGHPDLLPFSIDEDPMVNGEKSIRIFVQSEIIPKEKNVYRGIIEEIEVSDQDEDGRFIIKFLLNNIERVLFSTRRKENISNIKKIDPKNYFYFSDFNWSSIEGRILLENRKQAA